MSTKRDIVIELEKAEFKSQLTPENILPFSTSLLSCDQQQYVYKHHIVCPHRWHEIVRCFLPQSSLPMILKTTCGKSLVEFLPCRNTPCVEEQISYDFGFQLGILFVLGARDLIPSNFVNHSSGIYFCDHDMLIYPEYYHEDVFSIEGLLYYVHASSMFTTEAGLHKSIVSALIKDNRRSQLTNVSNGFKDALSEIIHNPKARVSFFEIVQRINTIRVTFRSTYVYGMLVEHHKKYGEKSCATILGALNKENNLEQFMPYELSLISRGYIPNFKLSCDSMYLQDSDGNNLGQFPYPYWYTPHNNVEVRVKQLASKKDSICALFNKLLIESFLLV